MAPAQCAKRGSSIPLSDLLQGCTTGALQGTLQELQAPRGSTSLLVGNGINKQKNTYRRHGTGRRVCYMVTNNTQIVAVGTAWHCSW